MSCYHGMDRMTPQVQHGELLSIWHANHPGKENLLQAESEIIDKLFVSLHTDIHVREISSILSLMITRVDGEADVESMGLEECRQIQLSTAGSGSSV